MTDRTKEQARSLAQALQDLDDRLRGVETKPGLAFSAIEGGRIEDYDTAGSLRGMIGTQPDGTHTVTTVNGPVPPRPTAPVCTGGQGTITARWDGVFLNDQGDPDELVWVPSDFARVEAHASTDPDFTAAFADTLLGTIETPRGSDVTTVAAAGTWYVRLVARSQSGKASLASPATAVVVEELVDVEEINRQLDKAAADLATAKTGLAADLAALDGKLTTTKGDVTTAQSAADAAKTAADAAQTTATTAQSSANGKTTNYYGPTEPTGSKTVGDTWFQRANTTAPIIAQWQWDGSKWATQTLDSAVIANVDAGKITSGTIDADRIAARSLSADRLTVGVAGNLIVDPNFNDPTLSGWRLAGRWQYVTAEAETCFRAVADGTQTTMQLNGGKSKSPEVPVSSGVSYALTLDYKGSLQVFLTIRYANGALETPGTSIQNLPTAAVRQSAALIITPEAYTHSNAAGTKPVQILVNLRQPANAASSSETSVWSARFTPRTARVTIEDGAINADKLAAGAVVASTIGAGAITTEKLDAGAVTTVKLAAGAVTANEIASQTITAGNLAALAVTAGKIDALAVSTDNLAANAVTAAKIAAGAVTATTIAAGAVTAGKLAADSVTATQIAGGAIDGMTITGATIQTSKATTGVKITSQGMYAYDANGTQTVRINGSDNRIAGVLSTAPSGKPGMILTPVSTGGAGAWFSSDGTTSGTQAAIYADSDWDINIRSRNPSTGNGAINLRGGLNVIGGGAAGGGTGKDGADNTWVIDPNGAATFTNGVYATKNLWLYSAPTSSSAPNCILAVSPAGQFYRSTSSLRYKKYIRDYDTDPRAVMALRPVTWISRKRPDEEQDQRRYTGFIAEELAAVVPEFVTYCDYEDGAGPIPESVDYERITALLVKHNQSLQRAVDKLTEANTALTARVEALEAGLADVLQKVTAPVTPTTATATATGTGKGN